jgi:hypothetical protein
VEQQDEPLRVLQSEILFLNNFKQSHEKHLLSRSKVSLELLANALFVPKQKASTFRTKAKSKHFSYQSKKQALFVPKQKASTFRTKAKSKQV